MSQPPEQPYPTQGATLQQPNLPEEEIPTQRTPRVVMPTQQSSTQEKSDPRAADSAAAAIEETPTQRIRRIATPTHHPSTPEKADGRADDATVDADKVAPASTGSEDADTVEIPSVLAVYIDGRKPAADIEKTDEQQPDLIAAQTKDADTAPASPNDAVTLEKPSFRPVVGAVEDPIPSPEEQVVGAAPASSHLRPRAVPTSSPAGKKRLVSVGLAASALSALLVGTLFVSSRDADEVTAQSVATDTASASATAGKPTGGASTGSTDTKRDESTIKLKGLAASARPFETVRIQGTYPGGADTYLRVQRWEEGEWLAFPIPTKTDQSGKFTAYVELGQPGRYPLRVLDPDSGTMSKTFVLLIES